MSSPLATRATQVRPRALFALLAAALVAVSCKPSSDGGDASDSSATTKASSSASATSTDTATAGDVCDDATPIMQADAPDVWTGWERCADGLIHRAEIVACAGDPGPTGTSCAGSGDCDSDADCNLGLYGRCVDTNTEYGCVCAYGCKADADCPSEHVCACGGAGESGFPETSRCVPSQCSSTGDCDEGRRCVLAEGCDDDFEAGCYWEDDECTPGELCFDGNSHCLPKYDETWWCSTTCCNDICAH